MKAILLSSLMMFGVAQPPANKEAPPQNPPPKKETTEGNSDLQKLTPTVLQDLAKRIENGLIDDNVTGSLGLRVTVEDQVLVINGDAPDEAARKRASDVATNVANDELYRITNRVRVKPAGDSGTAKKAGVTDTPTAPDLAQLERVDAVLRDKLPELARTIRARFRLDPMPCVVLEGIVDTLEQKLEVSRAVRAEVRSLPLLNNITLRIKSPASPARPVATEQKQPRQMGPQNKAVAIDSDTREESIPLAGAVGTKIMGDSRIWDTVVLIQADGGLVWLKGTVESFPMKVRCVNLAQRTEGVTYVIDDLTVAVALRGAKELSVAKQREGVSTEVLVDDDAVVYFKRYLRDSVPAPGAYTVEAKDGTVRVVLRAGLLSPDDLKRVGDSVQKMAADLGVKAVVDVRPSTGTAPAVPPPTP